jgi:hypothetical protein
MIPHIVNYVMEKNLLKRIVKAFNGQYSIPLAIVSAYVVLVASFELAEINIYIGLVAFLGLVYGYLYIRGINVYKLVKTYLTDVLNKK